MSSLSRATVVKIDRLDKHNNADTLEIAYPEGFPVIVKRGQFVCGDLAVYIPCDMITSTEPEFEFIGPDKRIRASRIRGIFSAGLLIRAREHHQLGNDVTDELGLKSYEAYIPKGRITGDEYASPPNGAIKYTDIVSLRKYQHVFESREQVAIVEKIDGCCSRFLYQDGQLHIGSRNHWLKLSDTSHVWSQVATQYNLCDILKSFPQFEFFGESYGIVNKLRYEHTASRRFSLRFFDVFDISQGKFLDWPDLKHILNVAKLESAPILYEGEWLGFDSHYELAQGESKLAKHTKEGIVVRPVSERWDDSIGRVITKLHSEKYLEL